MSQRRIAVLVVPLIAVRARRASEAGAISALVLTFSYGARHSWSLRRFWARRYWLVGLPYFAWTAIYLLADGLPTSPAAAVRQFALDLADGGARYHLYLLLVSMQTYLVFPAPAARPGDPPVARRSSISTTSRS